MKLIIIIVLCLVALLALCAIIWFVAFLKFRARMQHYIFAHQLLPAQMFADPAGVLVPLFSATGFSKEGLDHLLLFWNAAGEELTDGDLVSADSLAYSMEVLGHPNSTAILVQLPPPEKKTEAYFALMVFDGPGLCTDQIRQLRYFVLEKHGEATAIGEWIPKDNGTLKYVGHGDCKTADKSEFLEKVQGIIEASGTQP